MIINDPIAVSNVVVIIVVGYSININVGLIIVIEAINNIIVFSQAFFQ